MNLDKYKAYAIKLLGDLISFESVLDEFNKDSIYPFGIENKKALDYLLSNASNDGFTTKNIDNYAGHIEFGDGDEILGILAHLDVVPVDKSEWTSYPFKLDIRDGKMYGRGTMDDKGPLVAAYIALKMLKDEGFNPRRKIRLIAGCDEESGSRCLEHYLKKEKRPDLGFSPDASFPLIHGEKGMVSFDIIGDISDDVIEEFTCGTRYNMVPSKASAKLKINLDNKYLEYLKENNYQGEIKDGYLISYGLSAHAMCPENGVNAAFILFNFINKYTDSKIAKFLDKYFLNDTYGKKLGINIYDDEMKHLTINFAIVNTNNGKMKLGFNSRVPLNDCIDNIENKLIEITKEFGYSFEIISKSPRHYVAKDSELVTSLMKAYIDATGDYENEPYTIGGGTYAREIGNAVAFGPLFVGREDVCHIADEYIIEEDFYKAIEIYYNAIYELCK